MKSEKQDRSLKWIRSGGLAGALVGILCWIKVLLGLSGPLSVESSLPYRVLVIVLVPLGLGAWLQGLSELPLGKIKPLAKLGVGVSWLGIAYAVLAGLEQYFVDLIRSSIPWAGSGYVLMFFGLLLVGIAVLLVKTLPVWRILPLVLGLPIPLLMLTKIPQSFLWISLTLIIGAGFLYLGRVSLLYVQPAALDSKNAT